MEPAIGTDLLIEHAHADREIEALARAVNGTGDLKRAFVVFEIEILRHFASEERELLIAYEREEPQDAVAILGEHEAFRTLLRKMHLKVDEGKFGIAELRELRIALTLHHAHEETGLYPWARSKPSGWGTAHPIAQN